MKGVYHTEWLFDNNSRYLGWAINDSRVDEKPFGRFNLTTDGNFPTFFVNIVKERLHALKLRLVLQRAMCDTLPRPITQRERIDLLHDCFLELRIYAFMNKYTLYVETNLA